MLKLLKFTFILFMSSNIFGQNKEEVYVILDNNSFYEIIKKQGSATLEIPYYTYKKGWNKENSKNSKKSNNDIVKVEAIPNEKSYRFHSIKNPTKKSNIDEISTFSVVDVSKGNKSVWKKYPYEMIFIEKLDCENYLFWHMKPEFNE